MEAGRRPRRAIRLRRDPRQPRAEPDPAACRARRPQGGLRRAASASGWPRPTAGLITDIIACPGLDYCALANARSIPVAQEISRALRLARAPARHRRAEDQDLRLHQCLRPSPCRPYRHSRRREEGRGALPDHARRLGRRAHLDRRDHRPRLRPGRDHRRHRDDRRDLSPASGSTARRSFLDAYRRVGPAPFKEALYASEAKAA